VNSGKISAFLAFLAVIIFYHDPLCGLTASMLLWQKHRFSEV